MQLKNVKHVCMCSLSLSPFPFLTRWVRRLFRSAITLFSLSLPAFAGAFFFECLELHIHLTKQNSPPHRTHTHTPSQWINPFHTTDSFCSSHTHTRLAVWLIACRAVTSQLAYCDYHYTMYILISILICVRHFYQLIIEKSRHDHAYMVIVYYFKLEVSRRWANTMGKNKKNKFKSRTPSSLSSSWAVSVQLNRLHATLRLFPTLTHTCTHSHTYIHIQIGMHINLYGKRMSRLWPAWGHTARRLRNLIVM